MGWTPLVNLRGPAGPEGPAGSGGGGSDPDAATDAELAAAVAALEAAIAAGDAADAADLAAALVTVNAAIAGKANVVHGHAPADVTGLEAALALAAAHAASTSNPHNVTKAQVGLPNVDNTPDTAKPISTATQTALDGKASTGAAAAAQATADAALPRAGGTMTGTLTLAGDPATALQAATRQFVLAQVAALVNGAPGALDTLKELADQLAADESAVTALTSTVTGKLSAASNLSDLLNAATARGNLGLGSAAVHAHTDYDVAGAAAAAQAAAIAASQPADADLLAIAALSTTSYGRAFLTLADAAAARTALGLGSAALSAASAFDAAGAAAAAQAASQPSDSDLTAIAALTTTTFGRSLLTLADLAALRAVLAPRRVVALTDGATITPNADTTDVGKVTIAATRNFAAPTGTPGVGQQLQLRIKLGGAFTYTFDTGANAYRFSTDLPAPSTSGGSGKTDYVMFQWNADDSRWDCLAVNRGF